jgi:hypothetical protein
VPAPEHCANCGAAIAGEYCSACGQRVEPHIHSVWGFLREATESLTHADSRLWRTLGSLLVRPGFLTREFLQGRRARYLPPFRLYLVVSVLFFVVASLLGGFEPVQVDEREAVAAEPAGSDGPCTYKGPWQDFLGPRVQRGCERIRAEDGGRMLGKEFMTNVPRMLFLFLPLIAIVMKLLYWRPKRYYVEHLLFFVHIHSFTFVLFTLLMLLTAPLPEAIGSVVTFAGFVYCAWYVFRAMRVVYGQSPRRTFAKYAVLSMTYLIGGSVLTALTLAYSFLAL